MAFMKYGWTSIEHVDIVGINWDFCVAETVSTLSRDHKCRIISDCVSNATGGYLPLDGLRRHPMTHPPKGRICDVLQKFPPLSNYKGWGRRAKYIEDNIEVV